MAALEGGGETERIRVEEAEGAVASARAEQAGRKEESARRQAEWEGMVRESGQLGSMIEDTAGEIAALTREAEAARAEHQRLHGLAEQAKSDLMVRVTMHSNALSGRESMQRVLEENARVLARFDERIAEAEEARGQATAALSRAVSLLESGTESRRSAEAALSEATSRCSALARVQEQRDWASSGVRAVLNNYSGKGNGSSGEERGIVGVIGELIETDAEYERAVEAVLGERIQSIVVRDQSEGLSALQYLKESREGRGAFVPVTLRSREESVAYVGEEGVLTPLADVVRVSEECGGLVRGLLGGTLLVRDLKCALKLWNRNGVWNSYVTLDGDMVTADGILVGGAQEKGESRVLAVKREIRELEKEVSRRAGEVARLAEEESRVRRERGRFEEELARLASLR